MRLRLYEILVVSLSVVVIVYPMSMYILTFWVDALIKTKDYTGFVFVSSVTEFLLSCLLLLLLENNKPTLKNKDK